MFLKYISSGLTIPKENPKSQFDLSNLPVWIYRMAGIPWALAMTLALSSEGAVAVCSGSWTFWLVWDQRHMGRLPPALCWSLICPSTPFLGLPGSLPLFWFPKPGDLSQPSTLVPPIKTWGDRLTFITCQLISAYVPAKFGDVFHFCSKCQLMAEPSLGLPYSLVSSSHSVCQDFLLETQHRRQHRNRTQPIVTVIVNIRVPGADQEPWVLILLATIESTDVIFHRIYRPWFTIAGQWSYSLFYCSIIH